jgi:hypothetical protein
VSKATSKAKTSNPGDAGKGKDEKMTAVPSMGQGAFP